MSTATLSDPIVLGLPSAGMLMTPEEFDAVEDYDEEYQYELINGVLVVSPIPLPAETDPNDLLGYLLRNYREVDPRGAALDGTLPQQYVYTATGRRIADRLIWTGLGRKPRVRQDTPGIAVEFVSAGKRNRKRDYVIKRSEYLFAGIREYWIFDRFRRTLTVIAKTAEGEKETVISGDQIKPTNRPYCLAFKCLSSASSKPPITMTKGSNPSRGEITGGI